MQDKKSIEQVILQKFANLFKEFPKGEITPGESPDFLIRISARKAIGIELTELRGQDFLNRTGRLIDPQNVLHYIKHTVQKKETKVYLYRKNKLFQLWLVVYLNSLGSAITGNMENRLQELFSNSGFDRIFLLELVNEKLYELLRPDS